MTGVLPLLAASLVAQDARTSSAVTPFELPVARPLREYRLEAGLAEPLWISLAGRKIQGQRAHLLVEFAGKAIPVAGLTLLEPAGAGIYFASLDLSSALGSALQVGDRAAAARAGLRGARVLEEPDKLPLSLPAHAFVNASQTSAGFDIYFFADADLAQARTDLALLGVEPGSVSEYFRRIRVTMEPRLLKAVARLDWVQFIAAEAPAKRRFNNRESGALIQVGTLQGPEFGLTGREVTLGIVDADVPAQHREFTGRLTAMEGASRVPGGATHATHVAGTMMAAGEFDAALRGMSPAANLRGWHFNGDEVQKMVNGAAEVVAFNNSWGLVIDEPLGNCNDFGGYGGTERDLDRLIRDRNVALVFATGNDRDLNLCSLLPQAGYYSTSRPAAAKNVITVSAARSAGEIAEFGGIGPARDGRIKPDLVALGVGVRSTIGTSATLTLEGTSMAAPAVTGTIGLLAERYAGAKSGERLPADLAKAVLLNTAKDMGNPGPDYTYGYGLVQAVEAVKTIDAGRFARDKVTAGGERKHEIEVPAGAAALRVMLVYNDLPAAPEARATVVQHLDIELAGPGGAVALPLGLDPLKPSETARPRAGIRDVSKQIAVDKPAAGKWTLTVKGLEVAGEQEYAVAWTLAENPTPACSATVSSARLIADEKPSLALLHVNANNHCEGWQATGVPDWIRAVGGEQKGTGVVKLAFAENNTDEVRRADVMIANQRVAIRQNPRCVTAMEIGQTIEALLGSNDCLKTYTAGPAPTYAYVRKYEFTGTQGQRVTITMNSPNGAIDPYLFLLAPGEVVLDADDDSGGNYNARIPFQGFYVLPYTGTYTIWATTAFDEEQGSYILTVTEGPVAPGGSLAPKMVASCPAQVAGELTASSSTGGRRGDLFRTDVYQFFARIGQELTLEIPQAAFDPFAYLLDPVGRTLGTLTNDGSATPQLRVTAPRTGTYSVEFTSFAPFATGPYAMRLEGCSPQ